jgi:hypothetical protein
LSETLTRFIKLRLAPHGYEDCDPMYSLGYCQGDGVAFYGPIDVPRIAERVFGNGAGTMFVQRLLDSNVGITLDGKNSRYHHEKSMTVTDDPADIEESDSESNALLEHIVEFVRDDVHDLSCTLQRQAYSLIEATEDQTLWTFCTRGHKFVAQQVRDEEMSALDEEDDLYFLSQCMDVVRGRTVYGGVKLTVYALVRDDDGEIEDEDEVFEDSIWGCTWDKNSKGWRHYLLDYLLPECRARLFKDR